MKEKNIGTESDNRANQTKYVWEIEQKEHITGSFDIITHNKRRTDTEKGTIRFKTEKLKFSETDHADFVTFQFGHQYISVPHEQ